MGKHETNHDLKKRISKTLLIYLVMWNWKQSAKRRPNLQPLPPMAGSINQMSLSTKTRVRQQGRVGLALVLPKSTKVQISTSGANAVQRKIYPKLSSTIATNWDISLVIALSRKWYPFHSILVAFMYAIQVAFLYAHMYLLLNLFLIGL
jgi:hypothetical protein